MEHAHCDDTLVKRVKSPDGTLVVAIYDRSCSRGASFFTYAEVERPAIWGRGETVCYVITFLKSHKIDAQWKDNKHLAITSSEEIWEDELEPRSSINGLCTEPEITYDLQLKRRTPSTLQGNQQ